MTLSTARAQCPSGRPARLRSGNGPRPNRDAADDQAAGRAVVGRRIPGAEPRPVGRARRPGAAQVRPHRRRRGARRRRRQARAPHTGGHPGGPALHRPTSDPPPVGVPGQPPYVRGGRADGAGPDGWDVRQRHAGPTRRARRRSSPTSRTASARSGWPRCDGAELASVLEGVLLDLAPVVLDTGGADTEPRPRTSTWRAGSPTRPPCWAPSGSTRSGCAPAPAWARTSPRSCRWRSGWRPSTRWCARSSSTGCRYTPRAAPTPQELGFTMAAGVAYLRALTDAGLDVDDRGPAAGVPLRRHRRAVPHHREAARRPSALVARAGGLRRGRCGGPAPARRRRADDVHPRATPT